MNSSDFKKYLKVGKVTQGYVAWQDSQFSLEWRACWAHLTISKLTCFPHQYATKPLKEYDFSTQPTISDYKNEGIKNGIEIKAGTFVVRLGLQNKIDLRRWCSNLLSIAKRSIQLTDFTLLDSTSIEVPDFSSDEEFQPRKKSLEEIFLVKENKKKNESIKPEEAKRDMDLIKRELEKDKIKLVLKLDQETLTQSREAAPIAKPARKPKKIPTPKTTKEKDKDKEKEKEKQRKKFKFESIEATRTISDSVDLISRKRNQIEIPSIKPVTPVNEKKKVKSSNSENLEEMKKLTHRHSFDEKNHYYRNSLPNSAREFKKKEKERQPINKKLQFSSEKPTDINAILEKNATKKLRKRRKPKTPLGILKKSGISPKRVDNLIDRKKLFWKEGLTKFQTKTISGITYVKNPVFNIYDVQLREFIVNTQHSFPNSTTLDLTHREFAYLPSIVPKLSYLTVLNLYSNHLKFLPADIGNLHNLVQFGVNENALVQLPASISQLYSLEIFDLRYNKLQTLPEEIGGLKSIKKLFLRYNRLEYLPNSICKLKTLELLSIRNNNLVQLPENIHDLSELRVLDAHENVLTRLPKLEGLWNLMDLNVHYNQLHKLPKTICYLSNLKKLHIGHNKFRSFPIEICQLARLEVLDFESNMIESIPDQISNLTNLQQFYVSRNFIVHLPNSFSCLARLREFNADSNRMVDLPEGFSKLKELKELNISSNNFSVFPDPAKLQSVTSLDIHDNLISEIPASVYSLQLLKSLNIGENLISNLPINICYLSSLTNLRLNCNRLSDLPENMEQLTSLRVLHLDDNLFTQLPSQISQLTNLLSLSALDNQLEDLPNEITNLQNLKHLKLDGNPLASLPRGLAGGGEIFQFITARASGLTSAPI